MVVTSFKSHDKSLSVNLHLCLKYHFTRGYTSCNVCAYLGFRNSIVFHTVEFLGPKPRGRNRMISNLTFGHMIKDSASVQRAVLKKQAVRFFDRKCRKISYKL